MKMKYLKTFENFTDMGRFSDTGFESSETDKEKWLDKINRSEEEEEFDTYNTDEYESDEENEEEEEEFDDFDSEETSRKKVWGDEIIESKKIKRKPDFLDFDGDGNKKESMIKAIKDKENKKDDKKEDKDKVKNSRFKRKHYKY